MPTPKPTSRPLTGLAGLPDLKFKKETIDPVASAAQKTVANKMGIPVAQLSKEITDAISAATASAMNLRTKTIIQRDVDSAVKGAVLQGAKPLDMLDARVSAAKDGIGHIVADAKVDQVLTDTAKLLWKKYEALKKAGFSDTQAFDLVLAEVQGRSSRNR